MGVNVEVAGREPLEALRYEGFVVAAEIGAHHDSIVGRQGAEVLACGVFYDEGGPRLFVCGGLGDEGIADGCEAVGGHTGYGLDWPAAGCEVESDGDGDEVDVADVGEELGAIKGEFAEIPEDVDVWVAVIRD